MEKHILSKSTFIRGLQCHKSLYLYKNRYFLRDPLPPEQRAKFTRGIDVGVIARGLFPEGIDVSPRSPSQYPLAVKKTAELMATGQEVIYEAAFQYNKVLVLLDILLKTEKGWRAIEVKSSLKITDTYLMDAALQYYVISHSMEGLESISLMHINPSYIRQGELELDRLFTEVNVTGEAIDRLDMIHKEVDEQLKTIGLKSSPVIDIGPHCNDPYPCDFRGLCFKKIPENSVFRLSDLGEDKQWEYYRKGLISAEKVMHDDSLSPLQSIQARVHARGETHIDIHSLKSFLDQIPYPAASVKLLFTRPAIPAMNGFSPYQPVPFCLSLMPLENPDTGTSQVRGFFDGVPEHYQAFIEEIRHYLRQYKSLIIYNESGLCHFSSIIYPPGDSRKKDTNKEQPLAVNLAEVFTGKTIYTPRIDGNYSLPNVYAAITGEPYPDGGRIGHDDIASMWFNKIMNQMPENEKDITAEEIQGYGDNAAWAIFRLFKAISVMG